MTCEEHSTLLTRSPSAEKELGVLFLSTGITDAIALIFAILLISQLVWDWRHRTKLTPSSFSTQRRVGATFSLVLYLAACFTPAILENEKSVLGWQYLVIAFGDDQGLLSVAWWWVCNPIYFLGIAFSLLNQSQLARRLALFASGTSMGFVLVFLLTFAISGRFPLSIGAYLWSASMTLLYIAETKYS